MYPSRAHPALVISSKANVPCTTLLPLPPPQPPRRPSPLGLRGPCPCACPCAALVPAPGSARPVSLLLRGPCPCAALALFVPLRDQRHRVPQTDPLPSRRRHAHAKVTIATKRDRRLRLVAMNTIARRNSSRSKRPKRAEPARHSCAALLRQRPVRQPVTASKPPLPVVARVDVDAVHTFLSEHLTIARIILECQAHLEAVAAQRGQR